MSALTPRPNLMEKAVSYAACIPETWVTMTRATEHIWGTSGRGSPKAVAIIEACATLGLLEIRKEGRTRRVRRPT